MISHPRFGTARYRFGALALALSLSGCGNGSSYEAPTAAIPTPSPSVFTSASASSSSGELDADCTQLALRGAQDSSGARPLTEVVEGSGLYYDAFLVHACRNSWALVEASRTSGSSFDFWLLRGEPSGWRIVAVTGVGLDTPQDIPLFAPEELADSGVDATAVAAALGTSSTTFGKPIFESTGGSR
jgi:hypothetical protein